MGWWLFSSFSKRRFEVVFFAFGGDFRVLLALVKGPSRGEMCCFLLSFCLRQIPESHWVVVFGPLGLVVRFGKHFLWASKFSEICLKVQSLAFLALTKELTSSVVKL